jgi:hypothetical protein
MSALDNANEVYLETWQKSTYSNLVMLTHIVRALYIHPEDCDKDPKDYDRISKYCWIKYFKYVDQVTAAAQGKEHWKKAGENLRKGMFFDGLPKPRLDLSNVGERLWKGGSGLCTSFAIGVNEAGKFEATYVEQGTGASGHRAAHKTDTENSVLVIDSSAYRALWLKDGDETTIRGKTWKNDKGTVEWGDVCCFRTILAWLLKG